MFRGGTVSFFAGARIFLSFDKNYNSSMNYISRNKFYYLLGPLLKKGGETVLIYIVILRASLVRWFGLYNGSFFKCL
jgi:hypothetical protein